MAQDSCQPIRDMIEQNKKDISELEEFLPELPPTQRPVIKLHIAQMKRQLANMKRALQACMKAKETGS